MERLLLILAGVLLAACALDFRVGAREADVGVGLGSTAAAELLEHYVHHALRQPRQLQIELQSGIDPWFPSLALVESKNRIQLGRLEVHFGEQRVEAEWHNVTLHSDSHIHLLPLPHFLGADTAHLDVRVPRALIRLRVVRQTGEESDGGSGWALQVDECDMAVGSMHVELDRSHIINLIINPMHRLLLPRSLIHRTACNLLANGLAKTKNRFAIEVPLVSLVPEKFVGSLLSPNISLFSQLQSIVAEREQFIATATVDWMESSEPAPTQAHSSIINAGQSGETSINPPSVNATQPASTTPNPIGESAGEQANGHNATGNDTSPAERLEWWVEDRTINELLERFHWRQEWIDERIPMESPKLPQSTSAFLSTLCANCYFVLRVKGSGAPSVQAWHNATLVLRKGDEIHVKVVNPSTNVDAVFANFQLSLAVQLAPRVENGLFKTHVDLLETDVRMQEGAFPGVWKVFIQDLVRSMITDVIWPGLKHEIELLTWSDGVAIPPQCGIVPQSLRLNFQDGRVGASAVLRLEAVSATHCIRQLRSRLPDPSKLLVLRENQRL